MTLLQADSGKYRGLVTDIHLKAIISTAFGNTVVTRIGDSGTSKGVPFVFAPDADPFTRNSGDLTKDKMARLVEMIMDHS
jgi:hypothetical protein